MSPADLQTPTPPTSCALIIALPLTREAFEADLAAGQAMDYSRHQLLMGRPAERAWVEDGASLAEDAMALATAAMASGVLVCCASSLGCVAAVARAYPVVTFVAHWRASSLRGSDFRNDPARLLADIRAGTDELRQALAQRLAPNEIARIIGLPDGSARAAQMAELLNRAVIDCDAPLPGALGPGRELVYRPWLRMRHRQMLDDAFADQLWPGNRAELRDGLYAPDDIAGRFPRDWSGIVDLALCRSAAVAKVIKGGSSDRRVIFTQNEVVPQIRMRMLRELYRRLERGDRNYAVELAWMFRNMRDLTDGIRDAMAAGLWGHHVA